MLQYDPTLKTIFIAHTDYRIKEVYHDDGVYCLVPKDPSELLFLTNGKRLIRAHNFEQGRGLFIRYIRRTGVSPSIFTLTLKDTVTTDEGVQLYLMLTAKCTEGLQEWLLKEGLMATERTIGFVLERLEADNVPDWQIVVNYFTKKDDFSKYELFTGVIPGMEPDVGD